MGTHDVLGGLNHPLQSFLVLGREHLTPVCDFSSYKAFYHSSVKAGKSLEQEFDLL